MEGVMLRKMIFFVIVVLALGLSGCYNEQDSSIEAATYNVSQLPNWEETLWVFNFRSGSSFGIDTPEDPWISRSNPRIAKFSYARPNIANKYHGVIYLAIWADKNKKLWVSGLNDSFSPQVVFIVPLRKQDQKQEKIEYMNMKKKK